MARYGAQSIFGITALLVAGIACAAPTEWVLKSNYAQFGAKVETVELTDGAELVGIDTGTQSNLRAGAVCKISRGTTQIAEAIVVSANLESSVALVLKGGKAQKGDAVYITPAN